MPCPWYQYGVCTSPKLPEPTDSVVTVDRCSSEDVYMNCAYYVATIEFQKTSKKTLIKKDRDKIRIYIPIHALPSHLDCQCIACKTNVTESGIRIAYCNILDRYLTKYEVYLCNKYWKECPYRSLGIM